MGNGTQLGHASSYSADGPSPPASAGTDRQRFLTPITAPSPTFRSREHRQFIYGAINTILFAIIHALPIALPRLLENVSGNYQETIGIVAISTTVTVAGYVGGVLLAAIDRSRLFNLLR